MLVVYLSNSDTILKWGNAPSIGDASPIGKVEAVEVYQGELDRVCMAVTEPITREAEESFNVQLSPDRSIIRYGWNMVGRAPTGRLKNYEPTSHETLMRAVPSEWYVELTDTCQPQNPDNTYSAVHLCHCVNVGLPVAV